MKTTGIDPKSPPEAFLPAIITALQNLTLGDNFSAQVVQVMIPATTEVRVPHGLKSVPLYRIILRQRGNGLVTDGTAEAWNDKYITLYNQGAAEVTITVMILRG